jgi:hypothetical protein
VGRLASAVGEGLQQRAGYGGESVMAPRPRFRWLGTRAPPASGGARLLGTGGWRGSAGGRAGGGRGWSGGLGSGLAVGDCGRAGGLGSCGQAAGRCL